jgi:hypothetical protein
VALALRLLMNVSHAKGPLEVLEGSGTLEALASVLLQVSCCGNGTSSAGKVGAQSPLLLCMHGRAQRFSIAEGAEGEVVKRANLLDKLQASVEH